MEKLRKFIVVTILFTLLGASGGAVFWVVVRAAAPKYTAEALIKVLPPPNFDPFDICSPHVSSDIQYARRVSTATLITRQSTLEELLRRDKVRQTEWFAANADTTPLGHIAAIKNLRKNLKARPMRDADFVTVSMTTADPAEAAIIVNEMLDMFLAEQSASTMTHIALKLQRMSDQLNILQRELNIAEESLDDVRRATAFIDLQERNGPRPLVERLIRLDTASDDLQLDIAEAEAWVQTLRQDADANSENTSTPLQEARDELTALIARAEQLKTLKDAAAKEKRDFDNARIQFERRAAIRDERLGRVNETKAEIERLRLLRDDAEASGLRFVASASDPIVISSPKLRRYVPKGAIFGLIAGVILGTLSALGPGKHRGDTAPL